MATARALLILSCIMLLSTGCTSLSGFDPPTADLIGLEPLRSSDGQPSFLVKMRVVNPNARDLHIRGIYYEISVEGHKLFNGASNQTTSIPGYGEGVIEFKASPSLFGIIRLFKTLVTGDPDRDRIRYRLYTKLSLGGKLTPFKLDHQGELSLRPETRGSERPALGI